MRAVIAAIFTVGSLAMASGPFIRIREVNLIKPQNQTLTLGDIAEVQGFQPEDARRLCQINIGDAPHENENREISSFALSEILRVQVATLERHYSEQIELSIPRKVRVELDPPYLTERKAQTEIQTYYQSQCQNCEISVSPVQISLSPTAHLRNWSIDFKSEVPRGSFSLPLHYALDGSPQQTAWVSGKIQIFRRVPVANRNINLGERLQSADITQQRRDITFGFDNVPEATDLVGAVAAKSVMANQIVWKNSLQRQKALNRGDVVKIISGSEMWQVSLSGVAQQAGFIGDVIQVTSPQTKKTLSGLIVDKGVVRVQ